MADPYQIRYAALGADDLRALRAFDQQKVLAAMEQHLLHEPTRVSKSRIKLMTQPFWSGYRLRVDDFRVYYDVDEVDRVVMILRVLEKGSGPTPAQWTS